MRLFARDGAAISPLGCGYFSVQVWLLVRYLRQAFTGGEEVVAICVENDAVRHSASPPFCGRVKAPSAVV